MIFSFLKDTDFTSGLKVEKMLETNASKEIRICMPQESTMKEHSAPGEITIMVLEGEVKIDSNKQSVTLKNGELVYFEARAPHSLHALKDSVIRLVLSKNDDIKRVESLIKLK